MKTKVKIKISLISLLARCDIEKMLMLKNSLHAYLDNTRLQSWVLNISMARICQRTAMNVQHIHLCYIAYYNKCNIGPYLEIK